MCVWPDTCVWHWQRTEERMDDSADVVQKVLAAAAEGNGEFELRSSPHAWQRARALMENR